MEDFLEKVKVEINKLKPIPGRVPYTYHHDYLRSRVYSNMGYSRGDIAHMKFWSEEELYATAFVYLLEETNVATVTKNGEFPSWEVCDHAIQVKEDYIARIKHIFPINYEEQEQP